MLNVVLDREGLDRLRRGAVVARLPAAVFRVTGPGALECLQGLFTCDLAVDSTPLYGAMLTPKGMIVADYWVLRSGADFILLAPEDSAEATREIFSKRLPPRLARVKELTGKWPVLWGYGRRLAELLADAVAASTDTESLTPESVVAVRGARGMPFTALVTGPAAQLASCHETLNSLGALDGGVTEFHAARILAGWPATGVEIDQKTLPQEVRFDLIDGVSYTKGCYVGQETVARVHFRGHPNRLLRGLDWTSLDPLSTSEVLVGDESVGRIHSVLTLPDRRLALAKLRHSVTVGDTVLAGGHPAVVAELPFDPAAVAA